jgi:lipoate-protein ligase A
MPDITTWRLIETSPASGAWNMAFDEALILSVGNREQPPTLRLYAWQPYCLSIGYAQPYSDVDSELLKIHGWDIVRRSSGGRAVLHTNELSYAAVGPVGEPHFIGSILDSYHQFSKALVKALHLLGVEVQAAPHYTIPAEIDKKDPICFLVSSNYEITYQGKKLVGNAQIRRKTAILQHGTLLLSKDYQKITDVLKFSHSSNRTATQELLGERVISMEDILQRRIRWKEAARAFRKAFMDVLSIHLVVQEPDERELMLADELLQEKYLNDAWTQRI